MILRFSRLKLLRIVYNIVMRYLLIVISLLIFVSPVYAQRTRFEVVNEYIESLDTQVPKDLIKAIAWVESRWHQFGFRGRVYCSVNASGAIDVGLMQISESVHPKFNSHKLRYSTKYNLECGVRLLEDNLADVSRFRKKFHISVKRSNVDVALRLYNGWDPKIGWKYVQLVNKALKEKPWERYLIKENVDANQE